MRRWNDLYNMGNDYAQYGWHKNEKPEPVPPPTKQETDLELSFGDDKLLIRLNGSSKDEISKIEVSLIAKE